MCVKKALCTSLFFNHAYILDADRLCAEYKMYLMIGPYAMHLSLQQIE